ncbi:MAG: UpxY family transcription antiterminator [Bacteroidales bacterium]|nr:UpxY family transcription antiterminator [Bacteroidales bacterium]
MDHQKKEIISEAKVRWYAVYTRPRAEKLVFKRFEESGIEAFLPMQKTLRQWSDRKKIVEKPLLSSYIFVKVNPKHFPWVYKTFGVVKFVTFEGKPVSIPQYQIDNLRLLVNSDSEIEVNSVKYEPGDLVEVVSGSLIGLKGELVGKGSGKRFIIRIEELGKNITVKIPKTFLRKITG